MNLTVGPTRRAGTLVPPPDQPILLKGTNRQMPETADRTVWTIGHSTRSAEEFLSVLVAHDIQLVIDVRRFPASRRLPQFDSPALEHSLARFDIGYRWLGALGGRRRPEPDSVNRGWRHSAFRAYADHLASDEFAGGLFELLLLAGGIRTTVMCAEVLWWRCHRRLIADVLSSLDVPVIHVFDRTKTEAHRLTPPARIICGRLSYEEP